MTNAATQNPARNKTRVNKSEQAQAGLAELLAHVLSPGFYGAGSLTVSVQDGHIQHLKISAERTLR